MIELNSITLERMNETVQRIVSLRGGQALDQDLARTVEIAGRQRMLSQKASKEACFFKLGLTFAIDETTMEATFGAFEGAMAQLINGDPNRASSRRQRFRSGDNSNGPRRSGASFPPWFTRSTVPKVSRRGTRSSWPISAIRSCRKWISPCSCTRSNARAPYRPGLEDQLMLARVLAPWRGRT
ncbi:MAG: hypothetical protein HC814_02510 [Rhodobacteraceae bacterium]|nr:hypothetical protein [Paracoccaceae bacterium]